MGTAHDKKAPNSFVRSVTLLTGGTVVAHGITAGATLLLTRLYTPSDFSVLALISGVLATVSVAACLRLEIAIPLARRTTEAAYLLALSMMSALLVASLAAVVVFLVPATLMLRSLPDSHAYLLWVIPIGIAAIGWYAALQQWFIRRRLFGLVAASRAVQSLCASGAQIGYAIFAAGPFGLIIGLIINPAAAIAMYSFGVKRDLGTGTLGSVKRRLARLRVVFARYSSYPKYSTWEALANSAAIQVPVILIAAMNPGAEAGYVLLATTVMQAPMALLGTSVAQVYASQAYEETRKGTLRVFTGTVLSGLCKLGVVPILAIGLLAPALFGIVFGEAWARSGWLVFWMTPWFMLQFVSSPLSIAIHVTGHQRSAYGLQLLNFVARAGSVWFAGTYAQGVMSEVYALSGALFYGAYLVVVMKYTHLTGREMLRAIPLNIQRLALVTGIAWFVLALWRVSHATA